MEPLVNRLNRVEAADCGAQVADGFGPLVRLQTEVEETPHGSVLDEDRVSKARERQPRDATEEPVASDHRRVQAVQLRLCKELEVVGVRRNRCGSVCLRGAPRQRIAHGISGGQHEHEPAYDACQGTALLAGVCAKPAERAGADAAESRCKRPFESIRVIGVAQRFEVADEESNNLVARGGARPSHLIRKTQRPQRLLERATQPGGAAQHDGEIAQPQVRRLRMQALDLAGAEKRLIDGVPLARDNHSGRTRRICRTQCASVAARLGRRQEPFARIQRLLRAPIAVVEPVRRPSIYLREVIAK